jgi:hypothetical protein
MHPRFPALIALIALPAVGVTATGCGGQPNRSQTATPPAVSSPADSPTGPGPVSGAVKQISIRVSGGQIDPPPDRVDVRQGQRIRLTVTSDRADEVHVHLYDLLRPLPAGGTATIEFTATIAGLAEVELEQANKQLVQLVIT